MELDYFTIHNTINSIWVVNIYIQSKTMKFLGDTVGEYVHRLECKTNTNILR